MIRPRSDWGAAPSRGTSSLPTKVGIAVHWEGPHMGAYTQAGVPALLRGIQRYHMVNQGWADIAYNFVVDRYGDVWEGRGWNARSAANGTNSSNSDYLAVCYLGGEGDDFTPAASAGISSLVAEHVARGGRPDVTGHRDHTATACPGEVIYQWVTSGGALTGAPAAPPFPDVGDDEVVQAYLDTDGTIWYQSGLFAVPVTNFELYQQHVAWGIVAPYGAQKVHPWTLGSFQRLPLPTPTVTMPPPVITVDCPHTPGAGGDVDLSGVIAQLDALRNQLAALTMRAS